MAATLLNSWPVNAAGVAAGRYWLQFGAGGFGASPAAYSVAGYTGVKLGWVSAGAKTGGAAAINLSLFDVDDEGNLLEQFQLGAPTDIGSAAQAGALTVGRLTTQTPSTKVQLWQRELVFAAAAVDVVGGAVNWTGRFVLWGVS